VGRILSLTGATTDWLDTREQGEGLLQQATLLEPHFDPATQEELSRWIANEASALRAVYGQVECAVARKQIILLRDRNWQQP
jgi:hypothetical protein